MTASITEEGFQQRRPLLAPAALDGVETFVDIALDLAASIPAEVRYRRILASVHTMVPCDASVLLTYDGAKLVPVAADGLNTEVLERRFDPNHQPRLAAILQARSPVRFAPDDSRPDPYEGVFIDLASSVHACMGCPLYVVDQLWGVLTMDASNPEAFDAVSDRLLAALAAMAGASILIETQQVRNGEAGLATRVDHFQSAVIKRTVAAARGNWAEAARRLKVDRSNLHRLARRLGLK